MMNKNLEERIDLHFREMAKKFDLFSDKISVRDREIDVINKEIAVVDGKHSDTKSNIDEKIGIFKDRLDLADKQIFTIQERLKRKAMSYTHLKNSK
ncbi:hypothetical protein C1646_754437 [Rhizophagus diaphanus]|nr:hypothetical protein C1646_754437 [Rhizophagus diaphanus] [Rhizophagus sp. MUCL 43196]